MGNHVTRAQAREAWRDERAARDRAAAHAAHPPECGCELCHLFGGPFPGCDCYSCTDLRSRGIVGEVELIVSTAELGARDEQDRRHTPTPATGRQTAYLTRLIAERPDDVVAELGLTPERVATLTVKEASAAIDLLSKVPAGTREVAPGETVGKFVKVDGEWHVAIVAGSARPGDTVTVRKASGDVKAVVLGAAHPAGTFAVAPDPEPATGLLGASDVPAGHYALDGTESATNETVFYRVDHAKNGRVYVKRIVGGRPEMNVRRDHVDPILARIVAAGVESAARRYGIEIGRCCRCNRLLTDDASRAAGIGPECGKRR